MNLIAEIFEIAQSDTQASLSQVQINFKPDDTLVGQSSAKPLT
jgi:hypothetical protein